MTYTCIKNFIYGNVSQYLAYQAIYEFDIFIDVVMETQTGPTQKR